MDAMPTARYSNNERWTMLTFMASQTESSWDDTIRHKP